MLKKSNRLNSAGDIRRVLRNGRRTTTQYYSVSTLGAGRDQPARIAVIVSRKVHSSAVARHLVQRRLRHVAQELIATYPRGYDMVVVAKPGAAEQSFAQLRLATAPVKRIIEGYK